MLARAKCNAIWERHMEDGATKADAGWFPDPDDAKTVRFWDGTRWTEQRAPAPVNVENIVATAVWALALACGVAGVLAWQAPAIVFFWPLGLGGAGASLILVARTLGEPPQWSLLASLAVVGSLILGGLGLLAIEDARSDLTNLLFGVL
jgi:hypothetical protein